MLKLIRLVVSMAIVLSMNGPSVSAETGDYLLGPQDRLMIRVYTLRKNVGEAHPWESLTGEFTIGDSGNLSMPIIGQVPTAGMSTGALADRISQSLKEVVGLADIPTTSVEVLRYRPFYVLGAVQEPGLYEFKPGLTVLQALGTARGLLRAEDMTANERASLETEGSLRELNAERIDLLAKLARLHAETSDAKRISFPEELTMLDRDQRVKDAIRDEEVRFSARSKALSAELEAMEQSLAFYEEELTTLQAKVVSLGRQAELTEQELKTVTLLVRKGIAVAPRQLAAESAQLLVEGNRLDLQVAILRAQQGLAQTKRSLVELPARYRRESIDEMVTTRGLLEQNQQKLATSERLLTFLEQRSSGLELDSNRIVAAFEMTRLTPDGPIKQSVGENDKIEPGDVLTVILNRPSGANGDGVLRTVSGETKPAGVTR